MPLQIQYKLRLLMHSAVIQHGSVYISDIVWTTAASARWQGLQSSTDMFTYAVPDCHQAWRSFILCRWPTCLEFTSQWRLVNTRN